MQQPEEWKQGNLFTLPETYLLECCWKGFLEGHSFPLKMGKTTLIFPSNYESTAEMF